MIKIEAESIHSIPTTPGKADLVNIIFHYSDYPPRFVMKTLSILQAIVDEEPIVPANAATKLLNRLEARARGMY